MATNILFPEQVFALPATNLQLLDLMRVFQTQVIAKLPLELSNVEILISLEERGISSFLLDNFSTTGQAPIQERNDDFFDLYAQASFYQNQTWDDFGKMDEFSSLERKYKNNLCIRVSQPIVLNPRNCTILHMES